VKPIFRYTEKKELNDVPRVLMMGTGKHKNLNGLIEAMKGAQVHIDIIGWPAQDELDKLQKYQIAHTIYNGLTDEQVYERYIVCDVLFMASFYEGFGMPIIEGQAVGRPVVTSNIGAMKEVAGNTAVLVDPNNADEIRTAIMLLINDRGHYDKMVALGRENIIPYDYQLIAEQYLNVYRELA
jgi:glycosyltransferase involved in cell wall biosynthesis